MPSGIDVSHYQGLIDWSRVDAGFVWAKSSEGAGYRDPMYARNRVGARGRGIPFGAYHFLRPGGDPRAQAQFWRRMAGAHGPGDLRPAADLEVPGFTSGWLHAFMEEAEAQFGVRPVLYSYLSYIREHGWLAEFVGYPLWEAAYSRSAPPSSPWSGWAAWQDTDARPTPGVTPAPDGNVAPSLDPLLVPGVAPATSGGFMAQLSDAEQQELLALARVTKAYLVPPPDPAGVVHSQLQELWDLLVPKVGADGSGHSYLEEIHDAVARTEAIYLTDGKSEVYVPEILGLVRRLVAAAPAGGPGSLSDADVARIVDGLDQAIAKRMAQ